MNFLMFKLVLEKAEELEIKLPTSAYSGSVVKDLPANAGDTGLISESGKIPWRRKWQTTPVFLPGKSHRQRKLSGYNP